MKKSELVKMIREEVASILREKNTKRKRIKEEDAERRRLMKERLELNA